MARATHRLPWLPILAALLLALPGTAAADMPGWEPPVEETERTLRTNDLRIDLGDYADLLPSTHVVAQGDTLGQISKDRLGTTRRWEEVRDANPGIDPENLIVGSTLTLPPRHAPGEAFALAERWDFLLFGDRRVMAVPPGGRFTSVGEGGTTLIAVRHDKREALRRLAGDPARLRSLIAGPSGGRPDWLAVGPAATTTPLEPEDLVVDTLDVRRVTSIAGGVIHTERVALHRYDAEGNALTGSDIVARRHLPAMIFVFLGLLGFLLLVHVTMRRRRARLAASVASPATTALVLVALLAVAATPAAADIAIPGRKNVTTDVTLDFGPYADFTTRVHVVASGETAETIPTPETPKALEAEARALLEGVAMDDLKPGQRLRYPPSRVPKPAEQAETATAKHWWHVLSVPSPSTKLIPFAHGQQVPVQHYGTVVCAVRHDHLAAFEKAFADPANGRYRYLRRLAEEKPAWFATTQAVDAGRTSIKSSSPIHRIEKRMRITSLGDGVMGLEVVSTRWFDKDGKELTEKEALGASFLPIVAGLLAGGALLALVVLGLRRRREHPFEVAPAA